MREVDHLQLLPFLISGVGWVNQKVLPHHYLVTFEEKAVWNIEAKYPPEENPLIVMVFGLMFKLLSMELGPGAVVTKKQILEKIFAAKRKI